MTTKEKLKAIKNITTRYASIFDLEEDFKEIAQDLKDLEAIKDFILKYIYDYKNDSRIWIGAYAFKEDKVYKIIERWRKR